MSNQNSTFHPLSETKTAGNIRLTKSELIALIQTIKPSLERPVFIAVSGFGGSGKSTLAAELCKNLTDCTVVPIDDFIVGARSQRSNDWRTFDRNRLRKDVLEKACIGKPLSYKCYNSGEWVSGRGGQLRTITPAKFVIIEGCGVIHPSLMPYYDYSVWINCSQKLAMENAKRRDRSETDLFGDDDTDRLWDEVWGPNDRDYFNKFRPDKLASVLVKPQWYPGLESNQRP